MPLSSYEESELRCSLAGWKGLCQIILVLLCTAAIAACELRLEALEATVAETE